MSKVSAELTVLSLESCYLDSSAIKTSKVSSFYDELRKILSDRSRGAVKLKAAHLGLNKEQFLRLQLQLSDGIGPVLPEIGQGGQLYRILTCTGSDGATPDRTGEFRLHTDAPYHNPVPDWIALGKQEDTTKARTTLLNIDQWPDLDRFRSDPRSAAPVDWKEPDYFVLGEISRFTRSGIDVGVSAPVFDESGDFVRMRYRFKPYKNMKRSSAICNPEVIDYLEQISASLAQCPATYEIDFNVHDILIFNNHFMLHGRQAIPETQDFRRVLIRTRGYC